MIIHVCCVDVIEVQCVQMSCSDAETRPPVSALTHDARPVILALIQPHHLDSVTALESRSGREERSGPQSSAKGVAVLPSETTITYIHSYINTSDPTSRIGLRHVLKVFVSFKC